MGVFTLTASAVTSTNVNEDGYIEIDSIEDLYLINQDLTANYILTADIDMSEATAKGGDWDFGGRGWNPIGSNDVYGNGAFEGIFDGNGHTITGMRIHIENSSLPSGASTIYIGLFANVTGTVKDLTLTEGTICYEAGKQFYIGTVSGNVSGTIENCHSDIAISILSTYASNQSCYIGGIAGFATENAVINKSSNQGNIDFRHGSGSGSAKSYVSGIVGLGKVSTDISKCYNNGNITLGNSISSYIYVSGISYTSKITDSYNTGAMDATAAGQISYKYTYGIGGTATRCYNIGNAIGGAQNYAIASETSTNCFYLDGVGINNTGSTPLTKGQLALSALYTGFDFDTIWVLETEAVYPYPQLQSNTYDIRVIDEVGVNSLPDKVEYMPGEDLDLTGATIFVKLKNGTIQYFDIKMDMVSGYDSDNSGAQIISVNYCGFETSFSVRVKEKVFIPIYTIADLYNIRDNLSANYILMNDIDLTEATASGGDWDFDGRGWNPIGSDNVYAGNEFTGEFDGNGHSINGMRISISSSSMPSGYSNSLYAGLFAKSAGYVHDLNMENVDIYIYDNLSSTAWYAGAVCGNNGGEISNCSSSGRISVPYFDDYIGGITGYNKGNITECFNIAEVVEGKRAGGITGYNSNSGSVMNCYNAGIIHSNSDSSYHNESAGGITGYNAGAIENCYNSGLIKGSRDKYAIAYNYNGSIVNSYYLVNSGTGATNCVSLSEAQMKATASFRGFDFENVWVLNEFANHPYPQLKNNIQDMSESASLVSIIAPPIKTTYYVGDTLDLTDGIVKVVYVSGKEEIKNITADMLSGFDMNTAGEQDVVVSIAGAIDTYKIIVKERPVVESISISAQPNKSVFAVGTEFDFTGAKAFVTYVGGETETVSLTTNNTTGYNINHVGKQTVVFTLGDKSASFEVEVVGVEIEKIILTSLPDKLELIEGQELDLTGMVVTAVMNNGFENVIAEGYTVSGYSNVPGNYEITITYRDKTATFNVTVVNKKLVSLGINSLPDKLEYVSGQEFNAKGMQIIATYDNGDIVIAEEYTVSGFDSVPGIKNVIISLDDKSVSFPVKVIARVITEFKLVSLPSKIDYIEFDSFDSTGMKVEATYNDGITEEVKDYTITGFSSNPGKHTIIVAYKGFTESFDINVTPRVIVDIKVKAPNKVAYYLGEAFDAEGLVVTACYNNGHEVTVDDYQIAGFDSSAPGAKTITVTYGGFSRNFAVAVQERSVIETGGNMIVGNIIGRLGDNVVVPVSVTKNTGIAGFTHTINFDATNLKFVSVDAVGSYADGMIIMNETNAANGEITFLWVGNADVKGDSVVYNITFEILETAKDGNTEISVSFNENDNGNIAGENVIFGTINGFVEVRSYWLGDLNGDRICTMVDIVQLAQYVSGKEMTLTERQKKSADVNEDGTIDIHDVIMLNQWLLAADM